MSAFAGQVLLRTGRKSGRLQLFEDCSAIYLQELSESVRRANNDELLEALPSADLEAGEILEALRQSRAEH